ncbi:sigma factor-like helix-turn-helix DNA-binding protein [Mesorhizobium sp. M0767]|uniref:sigma factor-like helix-turn-helix DNA-binding protein n=1 Tax=Mesorhizobium sp. M0767 TaxID=2956995 RepID=UPI00333CFC3B
MAAVKKSAAPGFGKPGSIDPARLFKLPLAMQAEGIRLLFEMGLTASQVKARLGLSSGTINQILDKARPFTRGGDVNVVAEGM